MLVCEFKYDLYEVYVLFVKGKQMLERFGNISFFHHSNVSKAKRGGGCLWLAAWWSVPGVTIWYNWRIRSPPRCQHSLRTPSPVPLHPVSSQQVPAQRGGLAVPRSHIPRPAQAPCWNDLNGQRAIRCLGEVRWGRWPTERCWQGRKGSRSARRGVSGTCRHSEPSVRVTAAGSPCEKEEIHLVTQ